MNLYVKKLNQTVANRQPGSQAMSEHFNYLSSKHPLSEDIHPPHRRTVNKLPLPNSPTQNNHYNQSIAQSSMTLNVGSASLLSQSAGVPSPQMQPRPPKQKNLNTAPAAAIKKKN
jgi:hypothetical protein